MDIPALLVTAVLLTALIVACLLPVYADSADDRGDGRTDVIMPGYVRTPNHRPRTWAFLAISAVLGLLFLGWKRPSLPQLYSEGVRGVAVALTHDPASVNGYVARLSRPWPSSRSPSSSASRWSCAPGWAGAWRCSLTSRSTWP